MNLDEILADHESALTEINSIAPETVRICRSLHKVGLLPVDTSTEINGFRVYFDSCTHWAPDRFYICRTTEPIYEPEVKVCIHTRGYILGYNNESGEEIRRYVKRFGGETKGSWGEGHTPETIREHTRVLEEFIRAFK